MLDEEITDCMCRASMWRGFAEKIEASLFGACNDYSCPRNVFCKRTGFLPRSKNSIAFVDGQKCRANNYNNFVPITSEDTGKRK